MEQDVEVEMELEQELEQQQVLSVLGSSVAVISCCSSVSS